MLSLEKIQRHLLYKFNNKDELISSTLKLWENFTINRSNIADYLSDEKLVSAYTAFYFLTNYQKLNTLLDYADINPEDLEHYHIYDIGSGPGTFLAAFSEIVFGHVGKMVGIEKSEVMRTQAKRLLSGIGVDNFLITESNFEKYEGKRLAIFGHSINEMKLERAKKYLEKIDPDLIIVIEPGTKESFSGLLELRKYLLSKNYDCVYPCPSNSNCPMFGSQSDWCHQYMRIEMDLEVQELAQGMHLDRHLQAVSCFIFSRDAEIGKHASKRLVRYQRQTKHSFEWQTCVDNNGKNELQNLEVTKRGMSKEDIKNTENIFPGQKVDYQEIKTLPDKIRVGLL